jgi:signal transduction histidine kinase/PAS domain-containing protein
MDEALNDLARDAATLGGLPVVQLVLRAEALPARAAAVAGAPFVTAALAGSAVDRLAEPDRLALAEALRAAPLQARLKGILARISARRAVPSPLPAAALRLLAPHVADPAAAALGVLVDGKVAGAVRAIYGGPAPADLAERIAALARLFSLHLGNARERGHLARERATYKAYLDNAGDAVLVASPETGRILEANARAAALAGCRPPDLRRLTVGKLLSRPGPPGKRGPGDLGAEEVVRDEELLFRPVSGTPLPVSVTATRIGIGEAPVLHLVIRDLTRERGTLAALAQAKESLAALALAGARLQEETEPARILEVIAGELARLGYRASILMARPFAGAADGTGPLAIAHHSYSGDLLRIVERILGKPLAEVAFDPAASPPLRQVLATGRTVYADRPGELLRGLVAGRADVSRPALARVARVLGLGHTVLAPLKPGGSVAGVLVVGAPQFQAGDTEAIDAFAHQASIALEKARLWAEVRTHTQRLESEVERRTRELTLAVRALQELDRRKDNFLANVSHELRTPLVTMLGYNQLLLSEKMGKLDPRQKEALETSLSSGRRLKQFIEELLDFSRFELTRERMRCEALDIREPIALALAAMAPRTFERNLKLRARVSRRTPLAFGDRERLVQVLTNLMQNAERYCTEGGRIRVAAASGPRGEVLVSVSDDGAGIAPEHLDRIFDRLYQVGDAGTERAKGAGLGIGLNIVKSLVDAHGGAIRVSSRPGHGTRFRIALPAANAVRPPPAGRDEAPLRAVPPA